MRCHELDLKLSQQDNDLFGESKACGNLGNTYKMLERFDEAIHYCNKHLVLARFLNDQVGEGRSLYNLGKLYILHLPKLESSFARFGMYTEKLIIFCSIHIPTKKTKGNVYHTKGKTMAINSNLDLVDFPSEIKVCLLKAIEYYKLNLELMRVAGDLDAQGRACGNIGNTHYLLGEFQTAIEVHGERLQIAKQCADREAERRAHVNLANAHIFCGEFEKSIEHFK